MFNNIIIAVIDYGMTKNLKTLLVNLKVPHYIIDNNTIPHIIPSHIILSGSPDHVYQDKHRILPDWVIYSNIPVLGICYGMQIIAHTFGGIVCKLDEEEKGLYCVNEYINGKFYRSERWFNRFDNVYKCPPNFTILGVNDKNLIVSITDNIKFWGVQYHPENPNALDYNFFCSFFSYYNK